MIVLSYGAKAAKTVQLLHSLQALLPHYNSVQSYTSMPSCTTIAARILGETGYSSYSGIPSFSQNPYIDMQLGALTQLGVLL